MPAAEAHAKALDRPWWLQFAHRNAQLAKRLLDMLSRAMLYYLNEAAFELPDAGFVDRSIHRLETVTAGGKDFTVVVIRNPLAPGKSVRDVFVEHQDRERRSLLGWTSLAEREVDIDGCPAIEACIRWKSDRGMVYQRQLHLGFDREVLVVVANGAMEEREACDATMDRIVATFRVRRA